MHSLIERIAEHQQQPGVDVTVETATEALSDTVTFQIYENGSWTTKGRGRECVTLDLKEGVYRALIPVVAKMTLPDGVVQATIQPPPARDGGGTAIVATPRTVRTPARPHVGPGGE